MKKKGFTLVEILIVFSVLGILATASVEAFKSWQSRNVLSGARQTTIQALREAQAFASTGTNDSLWGVKYDGNDLILFSGPSYIERDQNKDRQFDLPISISVEGLEEIVFNKITGLPNQSITTTIFYDGTSVQVHLSTQGILSY